MDIKTDCQNNNVSMQNIAYQEQESISKEEFNNWLMNKVSRHSTMISRTYGEEIIQYLREIREKGIDCAETRAKYNTTFRFQVKKRKFQLLRIVGLGDILCLPMSDKNKITHAMLGQHRQVIFKEDMFDVIDNAHKHGHKHRGYKGTFKKISATYCNIPREVVSKYVSMCSFCQKTHACFIPTKVTKKKNILQEELEKKKEVEMAFMTRVQIDIVDMQNIPDFDDKFTFMGHFLDYHTKYNVLFPLKKDNAFCVAEKLCKYVFSNFGIPRIIHSNMGREFIDELISWVLLLWSADAFILNGNPKFKQLNPVVQQRQKTVMGLINTIRKRQLEEKCSWSSWLPGIQYSLNTNQFDPVSLPSYDSIFNCRPYSCKSIPSNGGIPREEDHLLDDCVNKELNSEVIVTSTNQIDSSFVGNISSGLGRILPDKIENKNETELNNTNILTSEILNSTSMSTIPLTNDNQQYTMIGTGLCMNGDTLQIPVVNFDNGLVPLSNVDGVIKACVDLKTYGEIASDQSESSFEIGIANTQNSLQMNEVTSNSLCFANGYSVDKSESLNLFSAGQVTCSLPLREVNCHKDFDLVTLTVNGNFLEMKNNLHYEVLVSTGDVGQNTKEI